MRLRTKLAALAVTAGVALTATTAFAFWSADGSGTGSGTVASTNPGSVSLSGSVADGLYPGSARDVTITVTNEGDQAVSAGTISLDSIDVDDAHSACDLDAFSMEDVDAADESVPAAADDTHPGITVLTAEGSLVMENTSSNQDACKGASLTLNLSSTEQ